MTITSSGPIAISNVTSELGLGATYSASLSFLNNYIVAAQRPASPALSKFYGLAYFQNNTQGNCNNGNCTANCNCGNIQCNNCVISGTVNCTNCDTQQWLQANCNCNTTGYNCTTANTSYNCNCDCSCCVVATHLTQGGLWNYDRLYSLTRWATSSLEGNWIGESFHRGYHVIGSKVFLPNIRRGGLLKSYFIWTFQESTDMLQGKPFSFWSLPNNVFWISTMFIAGIFISKRYAKRSWIRAYREIKNDRNN